MDGNQMFSKDSFNLFPKNIERGRNLKNIVYYTLIALLVINIGVVLNTLFLYNRVQTTNKIKADNLARIQAVAHLLKIDASIKGYKTDLNKILAYEKSISTVEAPVFEILKELEINTPSDISLNSVTLGEDGKIVLLGISKDEFVVCDFVTSLKSMDKLTDVTLKTISKKEDTLKKSDKYVNVFNIECQVKGLTKADAKKTVTPTPAPTTKP